jgi:hypothetical protein
MPHTLPDADINANKILEALTWLEFCSNEAAENMHGTLNVLFLDDVDTTAPGTKYRDIATRSRGLILSFVTDYRACTREYFRD